MSSTALLKSRRVRLGLLALAAALYAATRIAAVFSVAGNWDEFALLDRAASSASSGVFDGGGRPGLATLVLLPFAADCHDEIRALRRARLLWVGITLAFLAGLGVLIGTLQPEPQERLPDALLAVGLLALVPAFLEWSIQLRADQIGLACGVWGGVALLASRRRIALAAIAGLLFGVGYLATQKLVYVGALVGVLALGQLLRARDFRPLRETARAACCLIVWALCVVGFHLATTSYFEVPQRETALSTLSPTVVGAQMSEFEFYRKTIGYDQYVAMLPTLGPHFVLFAILVAASVVVARRRTGSAEGLWIAWSVMALGSALGAFHAAAFAYFWMTLGLFPAVAFAVARAPICAALAAGRERAAALVAASLWIVLAAQGIFQAAELLIDTQSVQRESLHFVQRNFDAADVGFHPEHAPFCRREARSIRAYFSQSIYRAFAGEDRERNTQKLLHELRERPVKFVLQSFRLNQFPVEIRRFLADNYQPYRASVFVAGRYLEGRRGEGSEFELVVPGRYRWVPYRGPQRVRIGDRLLSPGRVAELDAGPLRVEFIEDVPGGMLVLALDDPPGRAPFSFYKTYDTSP